MFEPEAAVDPSIPKTRTIIGGEDDGGVRLLIEVAMDGEEQEA